MMKIVLSELVEMLGINVPVYKTRVVGNRIELYLYGGAVKSVDLDSLGSPPPGEMGNTVGGDGIPPSPGKSRIIVDMTRYSFANVRVIAKNLKIKGRSKMSKKQLIEAINEHNK